MKHIIVKSCGECPHLSTGCHYDGRDEIAYSCCLLGDDENSIVKDKEAIDVRCPLDDVPSRSVAHEILAGFRNHVHCNPRSIDDTLDILGFSECVGIKQSVSAVGTGEISRFSGQCVHGVAIGQKCDKCKR